jgi:hypothetical protein
MAIASFAAFVNAKSSASVDEVVTVACRLAFQLPGYWTFIELYEVSL